MFNELKFQMFEVSPDFLSWDTSGIDKFKTVADMFVQHAQMIVYMYDAGRPETLEIAHIPQGAIIVANVYNYEGEIEEGHIPVNAYDRGSVDALLDFMIEMAPPPTRSTSTNARML